VVTVGTFDGVHLGHREVIAAVVARAREVGGRSVVVTFDPHPKEVVASAHGPVELLSTLGERAAAFERLGVDLLLVLPFTYEFSRLTSREFYERHVWGEVGVREVIVGHDHTFGRDREGSIQPLRTIGIQQGFAVIVLPPFLVDGERISSTRIRAALREGSVAKAARFLGSPYTLSGTVVPGDGRGRGLGYPTANIAVQAARKVLPADGVYVVQAELAGTSYRGMMNIGVRPTVTDGRTRTLEVHLLGSHGDLAGESIAVGFLERLRDERKFASLEELIGQLARDRAAAEKFGHEQ
jgi:riboflavin kinase/FMN adenylyltransferase